MTILYDIYEFGKKWQLSVPNQICVICRHNLPKRSLDPDFYIFNDIKDACSVIVSDSEDYMIEPENVKISPFTHYMDILSFMDKNMTITFKLSPEHNIIYNMFDENKYIELKNSLIKDALPWRDS
jgi:hypothetical protein